MNSIIKSDKTNKESEKQWNSKDRIYQYGEVFTPQILVEKMVNLVAHESERIESRFLEQACGEGAFLIEVLKRKINVIEKKYKKQNNLFSKKLIIAVSSIYGIDILEDNVINCRTILFDYIKNRYLKIFKENNESLFNSVKYLLSLNIVCGDCLTMKTKQNTDIIFSEWSPLDDVFILRRDFLFKEMSKLKNTPFIPKEIKTYKPVKYLEVGDKSYEC